VSIEVSELCKRFGSTLAADKVSFSLAEGSLLALLGPSGSGKTTVLRMLAGLERPDSGTITVQGRVLSAAGRDTPPEERDIGMVFQDYALWPHMTVAQNVAFGLRVRRIARRAAAERVTEALALVHLEGLGDRYPDQLSGGQQQRVAIARALAGRPPLLLLDEPLSNLDASLREEMRLEMGRLFHEQNITAIYVTHDRTEALAMADHIVVMRAGRVAQIGAPEELYTRPASAFIAGFLGAANFLRGEVVPDGPAQAVVRQGNLCLRGQLHAPVGQHGVMMARPEDGALYAQPPAAITENLLPGTVIHSEFLGGAWRHLVAVAPDVIMHALTPTRAPATQVWLHFRAERCLVLRGDP